MDGVIAVESIGAFFGSAGCKATIVAHVNRIPRTLKQALLAALLVVVFPSHGEEIDHSPMLAEEEALVGCLKQVELCHGFSLLNCPCA